MTEISGREILAKSIAAQGVRYVFMAPSPRIAPLIEAIKSQKSLQVVQANNATAAAAMADGYVRRSRKYAAVITDDKGAALSQISAITNAWADKIPVVSISLCGDQDIDFNKGVFRERFDQNGVFHAVTQWRKRVDSVTNIRAALEEGIARCGDHKMGPAHLDIAAGLLNKNVDAQSIPPFPEPGSVQEKKIVALRMAGDQDAVDRAAALIEQARRPLLFFGGGINASGAHLQALEFMQRWKIPAATTMAGVGAVPVEHDLCLGAPSYTGGETFHVAIQEADVIIAAGVGFSGLEGFGLPPLWSGRIKFIHIDISPFQIGLNVQPEVSILGDAATVFEQLSAKLAEDGFKAATEWEKWRKRLGMLKQGRNKRLKRDALYSDEAIHQGRLALELGNLPNREDFVVVIDGGNTALYAAMYAPITRPLQSFFPFGMSALGSGIPYAIGVKLAAPDKQVVLFTGDGSFMYNLQELETMCKLKLPIIILVNNDSAWNMIRAMQDSFFARNFVGTDLPNIDYAKIAGGFGLWSKRITKAAEILPAFKEAAASGLPALIDCVTDKRNIPDSLLSFTLVEFEGSLKDLNRAKLMKSLWLMKDQGIHRSIYMMTYIVKALLRINPMAGIKSLF